VRPILALDLNHALIACRVVSYEQCGHEYFTISNAGISYYRPGEEVEFTPLETFAKEYERYVRLIQVRDPSFLTFLTSIAFLRLDQSLLYVQVNVFVFEVSHCNENVCPQESGRHLWSGIRIFV
jgi:hypothetical protein